MDFKQIFLFSFVFRKRRLFPSLKKRVFLFICQCLPLFLPSLSHFPFSLSFSLSLSTYIYIISLSLSLSLFSCFLPSLSYFCPFLQFSFSFLACFFAFVSCKEQHQKITFVKVVFINPFCFLWFSVLFCPSSPLVLSVFSLS